MKAKTGEIEMLAAAYLFVEATADGKPRTQEQIGKQLGLSQAVVSRLLKEARSRSVLVTTKERFDSTGVAPQTMALAMARVSPRSDKLSGLVRDLVGADAPTIRVLPSSFGDWESRLREFATAAAPEVLNRILASKIVGISWGASVGSVVAAMRATCPTPPRARKPIRIVALIGEPHWRGFSARIGSSKLAEEVEEIVNGRVDARHPHTLSGISPLIPREVEDAELETAYKVIEGRPGYLELFGSRRGGRKRRSPEPFANRLDCIVTSLSRNGRPLGYGTETLFTNAGYGTKRTRAGILGDVCGVLIHPQDDLTVAHPLDARLTGIRREQFIDCSKRARPATSGAPGVVCVAIGARKAEVLARCLPFLNHLYIDQDLASALQLRLQAVRRTAIAGRANAGPTL